MSQNGARKFKRGDILFNENDPITSLLFVQTGRVKYFLPRGNGIDFQTVNAPFVTGELGIFSSSRYPLSAIAMTEITAYEIPMESAKQTLDSAPQFFKTLTKGLVEQLRALIFEVRTQKLESDPSPCPPEIVPRLFGGLYHTLEHLGQVNDDQTLEVDWTTMKKYATRIFNLPSDKMDGANFMMAKFGQADLKYTRDPENPDAPEQLSSIVYKGLESLKAFIEFYQFYYYKTGKQEILKYEEPIFNLVRGLLTLSKENVPDKTGTVKLDLNNVLDFVKKESDLNVTANHWQILEAKGLFSKRAQSSDGKFYIAFHLEDFQKTYEAWRFLREISKWNSTGSVNPKEPEFPIVAAVAPPSTSAPQESELHCQDCNAQVTSQQKFCGECGAKLTIPSVA